MSDSKCQCADRKADLQARHYSYECKATTQERPYTARPSRTQQLANPKLVPKLTSDVPNDLLRKKGVADEELAKKEADRGRKRIFDQDEYANHGSRKRSRSLSSASISTISTNLSRSPTLERLGYGHTGQSQQMAGLDVGRKRRRSPSTSMSYTSGSSHGEKPRDGLKTSHRKDHRRRSLSPDARAGARERDDNRPLNPPRRSERRDRSSPMSYTSDSSFDKRHRNRSHSDERGKRRRRSFRSPDDRGRDRDVDSKRRSFRTRSAGESRDRSQVTRNRKSMTPGLPSRQDNGSGTRANRPPVDCGNGYSNDNDRYGSSARSRDETARSNGPPPSAPYQRKERSLSPFSKRLALTQAMNMGHGF